MDTGELDLKLNEIIERRVNAKLMPVLELITGMETVTAVILDLLHHKKVVTREETISWLQSTKDRSVDELPPMGLMALEHVLRLLEGIGESNPAKRRAAFHIIREDQPQSDDKPDKE